MKFEWERIAGTPPTERARVFGGWIVRTFDINDCNTETTSEALVFLSDPEHKWRID